MDRIGRFKNEMLGLYSEVNLRRLLEKITAGIRGYLACAEASIFIYDAENKQVEVRDAQQNIIGQYRYDGDGRRIKKHVPSTGEVTVFVYDASGKSIAEYSTQTAQDPKVSYTTSDHLGSPRILTDENGSVISRRDFHPFGEEILTPQRVQGLGYQHDDVRQKFTGYERDTESDLDFAQARKAPPHTSHAPRPKPRNGGHPRG